MLHTFYYKTSQTAWCNSRRLKHRWLTFSLQPFGDVFVPLWLCGDEKN